MKNQVILLNLLAVILYSIVFDSLYLLNHGLSAYNYYFYGIILFIIHTLILILMALRQLFLNQKLNAKKIGIAALTVIATYLLLIFITGRIDLYMHVKDL